MIIDVGPGETLAMVVEVMKGIQARGSEDEINLCDGDYTFKPEYRHNRPVITVEMRHHLPCPFPYSEPDL